MMKKVMMALLYVFIGLIVFAVLYFATDSVLSRISADKPDKEGKPKNITVYVLSNDVHTDIVLPIRNELQDWTEVFPIE